MTIILEDGTGKSDAVSYASAVQYKTYCDARGISYAGVTDTVIEQSLVKATDAMVQMYSLRWSGFRYLAATQALDFPRSWCEIKGRAVADIPVYVATTVVPNDVINACIILAIESQSASLIPNLDPAVVREKIDVIEVEYDTNALPYTQFRSVDLMLKPYRKDDSGQLRIVR